jgi:phospholipase B1
MAPRRGAVLSVLSVVALLAAVHAGRIDIDCPPLPQRPTPTSSQQLHPNDFKVIAAMGDSITAAFAVEGDTWEYRDESWSIGGGDGKTTLANIMQFFRNDIIGASIGDHLPEVHGDPHEPDDDVLNAAQSSAKVEDLVQQQVPYLVQQMQANPNIDFANDWKLLTIWIGSNNLCGACHGDLNQQADFYEQQFDALLDTIHQTIPRVFVNVISNVNMTHLAIIAQQFGCEAFHVFWKECSCVFAPDSGELEKLNAVTIMFNERLHNLQNKWNMVDDQFAVVVQPMLEQLLVPDLSWVSTLDCFHPSLKTHQMLGVNLWNYMMMPIAQKPTCGDLNATVVCPTPDSLVYKV